jgi:two-component system, NarL family, nitrate/nitrite response regulator NarL
VELISQQKTSKQIAELLFLSERTVEGHRGNIIEKLGLPKEKNTLLKWAIQQKL